MELPLWEIQVSASVKSDRLWDPREVRCCSAVQVVAVGAGELGGAWASRRLFHNSTPKSKLLEEAARKRAPGSTFSCHFRAAVGKRSRRCWTLGNHVLWPHMRVRLLMRKFKGA